MSRARFLQRVSAVDSRIPGYGEWPYSIPFVRGLNLRFKSAGTFFVGENGSGKSTLVEAGATQFIIATHSPILLTYPGADIVTFAEPSLPSIALEDTSHYQITKGILEAPDRYWRLLTQRDEHGDRDDST